MLSNSYIKLKDIDPDLTYVCYGLHNSTIVDVSDSVRYIGKEDPYLVFSWKSKGLDSVWADPELYGYTWCLRYEN